MNVTSGTITDIDLNTTNNGDIHVQAGSTLRIDGGLLTNNATITIDEGATLTIQNGSLINTGIIEGDGMLIVPSAPSSNDNRDTPSSNECSFFFFTCFF